MACYFLVDSTYSIALEIILPKSIALYVCFQKFENLFISVILYFPLRRVDLIECFMLHNSTNVLKVKEINKKEALDPIT